jgi:hypothetical protein
MTNQDGRRRLFDDWITETRYGSPHPEERALHPSRWLGTSRALMVRDGAKRLLTMRISHVAAAYAFAEGRSATRLRTIALKRPG